MDGIARWISGNFAMTELIAVVMVIAGVFMALKMEMGKLGWVVCGVGVALGVWAFYLKGLI